ncbi:acyl-CoA dehydrogenase family protein [Actinomadura rudentiformis]|uniref:Acyl-CoA dehydrogenase family protein n=1 Tax=Actinomadura rudentiformis TaxID=359158 RepID=A0A6H9YQJ2_9ACTN|nr:acyl-CoA dehydrogenase family protein [Actinomadura rudentiformis]KAB2341546.1 acyl-CoA dehydrogenase family protein [Actinomadura rudentiformis]
MEFTLSGDLKAVSGLAEQIFTDRADIKRVREMEARGGFDADLWRMLAESGLIGLALPEKAGGAGLGMLGLVAVLEQQGRRVAPVPVWAVVAGAAMPIAEYGRESQRQRWLPGILDGGTVVTGAFERLALRATKDGGDWVMSGELAAVTAGPVATAFVVPFTTNAAGTHVAIVPADRAGLEITPISVTDHESSATLVFDRVRLSSDDLMEAEGATIVDRVRTRSRIALAALSTGVCQEAVAITASYTSQRKQFGRPLSTNQAVALRAADAHLDTERIRLATYKAAWHTDRGEEDEARAASLVAKWWASSGGLRAVHATQHLHGGIGADVDYPIHRYFLWGRQIAFTLGSAGAIEAELGDLLDQVPPIGASA